jgi:hypothetical protein
MKPHAIYHCNGECCKNYICEDEGLFNCRTEQKRSSKPLVRICVTSSEGNSRRGTAEVICITFIASVDQVLPEPFGAIPAWVSWVSKIVTDPVVLFAAARSGNPSPLKSPTATKRGFVPAAGFSGVAKVPSPLPRRTVAVLLPASPVTKSALPSPLISPTAMEAGTAPVTGLAVAVGSIEERYFPGRRSHAQRVDGPSYGCCQRVIALPTARRNCSGRREFSSD